MRSLYAPWRSSYTSRVARTGNENSLHECPFCDHAQTAQADASNLILKHLKYNMIILNKYPYANGHVLVTPYQHQKNLSALNKEVLAELMQAVATTADILEQTLTTHGINVGMNLGKAAGASVPDHIHMHVLPRWQGDTNFLTLLADTKPISTNILTTYHILKPHFEGLSL